MTDPLPVNYKTTLLTVENSHIEECGPPPNIHTADPRFYTGYFQNQYGEQWIFQWDIGAKIGTLRGGDIGWEQVKTVVDGVVPGLMLNGPEQHWLLACWAVATRQTVQEVYAKGQEASKKFAAEFAKGAAARKAARAVAKKK